MEFNINTVTLLLPVIWAVVSTLIGLVLYKSSKAIYQDKQLRLAGSVVIAALAFIGMNKATPTSRLEDSSQKIINECYKLATDIESESMELEACIETKNLVKCNDKIESLTKKVTELRNKLEPDTKINQSSN